MLEPQNDYFVRDFLQFSYFVASKIDASYEFSHEPRVALTARLQVWFCSANRDSQQAQYTRFREALNSCLRRLPVNTSLLHDGNKKKKLQTKTPKTNHCSKSTETSAERSRNFLSDNSGSCPKCKGRIDRMWKIPRPSPSIFWESPHAIIFIQKCLEPQAVVMVALLHCARSQQPRNHVRLLPPRVSRW